MIADGITKPLKIGNTIISGTPDEVLCIDDNGNLGQSPNITVTPTVGVKPIFNSGLQSNGDMILKAGQRFYFNKY